MLPKISVIIPCFNHGEFLDDAIKSIDLGNYAKHFEIIIVNDGSTDSYTLKKLSELSNNGIKVIHQTNKGLAEARNIGVDNSTGKYILPLDCDNKILPEVFLKAAEIMEGNNLIDVVYSDAEYFGEKDGDWHVGHFEGLKLLVANYIDACALIRKESLQNSGGYDCGMPAMGHEDWELWVRFYLERRQIYYLKEKGFYYRVVENSMSVNITRPSGEKNKSYIYYKHAESISKLFYGVTEEGLKVSKRLPEIRKRLLSKRFKEALKILLGKRIV